MKLSELKNLVVALTKAEIKKQYQSKAKTSLVNRSKFGNFVFADNEDTDEGMIYYKIPYLGNDTEICLLYINFIGEEKPMTDKKLEDFLKKYKTDISKAILKRDYRSAVRGVLEYGVFHYDTSR